MFDIEKKDERVWYYYDDEAPDLGGVCLKKLTPDEVEKCQELCSVKSSKYNKNTMQRENTAKVNKKQFNRKLFVTCLVDWKGVGEKGKELKCTEVNKKKAYENLDFRLWVSECFIDLMNRNEALEAARVKNSLPSSNGSIAPKV